MHDSFYSILEHFLYSKRYSLEYRPNYIQLLHHIIQFYYLAFIENKIVDLGASHSYINVLVD